MLGFLTLQASLFQKTLGKLSPPSGIVRIKPPSSHLLGAVAKVILVICEKFEPRIQFFGVVVTRMSRGQSGHESSGQNCREMHCAGGASWLEQASLILWNKQGGI